MEKLKNNALSGCAKGSFYYDGRMNRPDSVPQYLADRAKAVFAPRANHIYRFMNVSTITVNVHSGKMLKLLRAVEKFPHPSTWSIPGGKADDGETGLEAGAREHWEETRYAFSDAGVLVPAYLREEPEKNKRYLYVVAGVDGQFLPKNLAPEHDDYKWCDIDEWPGPPHPRVQEAIEAIRKDRILELAKRSHELGVATNLLRTSPANVQISPRAEL